MTGQVFEIEEKAGRIIKLEVRVDEFIIKFLVRDEQELKNIGFECEGKLHGPRKFHIREAFRVAKGYLRGRKKKKEAQEKQLSLNLKG
ncbi:MAG: hypothetical protein U5L76_03435 [Patescibacteria group bacterium]|nr:hypothetical protein [Patescibacteria group bacterium]